MRTTYRIGNTTIHRLVEAELPFMPIREFLPNLTQQQLEANRHWLAPKALTPQDWIILCFQSFVVKTPTHTVLVDACIGNDKVRPGRPHWHQKTDRAWMDALADAGLTVDDIDYVMCTHMHIDHVGWNTRLENGRWVPTFPRARYLFSAKELAFWTEENAKTPLPWIEDSVLPIVAAQRAQLVQSDHTLDDMVRLLPTPGHTIDHYSVEIGRGRADALITGDCIHSPLQALDPGLTMRVDYDPGQAVLTRRAVLERLAESDTLCCFSHFPSPSWGHVKRWESGFRCDYAD